MSLAEIMKWPFDQDENVATMTTQQVMKNNYPVLSVVHYSDDHSWGFTCGTTNDPKDIMLVSMQEVISTDSTLLSIADLPPGWSAKREKVGGSWQKSQRNDI